MSVNRKEFGKTDAGQAVDLFIITNANGSQAGVITLGAALVKLTAPDTNGKLEDITLGFDELDGYLHHNKCFGSTCGRFANRIFAGKFTLDGQDYQLAVNKGPNHLHGGECGFDEKVWQSEIIEEQNAVKFTYISPDGEENYPGELTCSVTYSLSDENELKIYYEATATKATPVNLTNHSYFNLSGQASGTAMNTLLKINGDRFAVIDKNQIPTGEMQSVTGTPLDFTTAKPMGNGADSDFPAVAIGKGFDNSFAVNHVNKGDLTLAAVAEDPASGRVLECYTTEPAVHLYTANFLDGETPGKGGYAYQPRDGFCLETQHYPDSPNKPELPNTILRPGETYTQTTIYKMAVK